MYKAERVRTVVFAPYRKGCGPKFRLVLWDENMTDSRGAWITGAELFEVGNREALFSWRGKAGYSDWNAVDSDKRVQGIMGFLTLKPGDTDDEYFANYTPRQHEFCQQHAETLDCDMHDRFGWDD